MKTVKLSYSILDAWKRGDWERAVGMYIGQPLPGTPEMELGKAKHEQWEQEIIKSGDLPKDLGGDKLIAPITERKYQKLLPFTDDYMILLRGVVDALDGSTIHEFKCGMTEAVSYVDSMQCDFYKLLIPQADRAVFHCFNPYFPEGHNLTRGIKFLNRANAESALEMIYTTGGELIDYLETQKMLVDYGQKA